MLCYCEKCGRIVQESKHETIQTCDYCKNTLKYIPQQFLIGERGIAINNSLKNQFINEYIKSSPEFDQFLFEHREQDMFNKRMVDKAKLEHGKAVLEGKDKGNPYGMTCPYCHATNIKKISTASRMISTSLFGLASSKIGKTYKCSKCGNTW